MDTFIARTRQRGTIDYFKAEWKRISKRKELFAVRFLEGPNKENKPLWDKDCAIAQDEAWKKNRHGE